MNWATATFVAAAWLSAELSTASVSGQVTLLAAREAKELIELIPDVAAANKALT